MEGSGEKWRVWVATFLRPFWRWVTQDPLHTFHTLHTLHSFK